MCARTPQAGVGEKPQNVGFSPFTKIAACFAVRRRRHDVRRWHQHTRARSGRSRRMRAHPSTRARSRSRLHWKTFSGWIRVRFVRFTNTTEWRLFFAFVLFVPPLVYSFHTYRLLLMLLLRCDGCDDVVTWLCSTFHPTSTVLLCVLVCIHSALAIHTTNQRD